jgi:hypothetical protein
MIIVEGPDGSGKTTLINHLVEATGLPVAPRVVSKDAEAMVDLKKWTEDNVHQGFQKVIYDRHRLISEPIYGPIIRSQPEPGFDDVEWLHEAFYRLYRGVKPIIIYCLPPRSVVWENVMASDDNRRFHGNPTAVSQIYSGYLTKATLDGVQYGLSFIYDYTDKSIAGVLQNYLTARVKEAIR